MDYAEWPSLLERIIPRLDQIVHNDFPIPSIPLPEPLPPSLTTRQSSGLVDPSSQDSSQDSQTTNKENAPPPRPAPPPFSATSPSQTPSAQDGLSVKPPDGSLPPQLISLLRSIENTLQTTFSRSPPHTIQRLAELLLHPRTHYRSLPSYLRALDRVVSVSSGADIFPLPNATLPNNGEGIGVLNGSGPLGTGGSTSGLGSDESLGGALLTPIPWLRELQGDVRTESTEMVDGPNGAGSIETVSVSLNGVASPSQQAQQGEHLRDAGAVTQGELLRQEQEAGVVPVSQSTGRQTRSSLARAKMEGTAEKEDEEEEHPHARGPEMVGVEDMGPQAPGTGFSIEAALGRSAPKPAEGEEEDEDESKGGEKEDEKDENVMLTDADGKTEEEASKPDANEENVGPDAIDTTML